MCTRAARLLLVCCCVLGVLYGAAAQGVKQTVTQWNLRGEILVLDVTSLNYQTNQPPFPAFTKPEHCADACRGLPGCNGWTFCNSKTGCGSGCSDYVKRTPGLAIDPYIPFARNPAWRLPIRGFGPWGATAYCNADWDQFKNKWVFTSRWPSGMCTLKRVVRASAPTYTSQNPNEGWVSGVLDMPNICAGASPAACEGCLATKNVAACLSCATSKQLQPANLALVVGSSTIGVGCVRCYNSSADPAKCVDCMLKGGACSKCPAGSYPRGNVDQCISCTQQFGAGGYEACRKCFNLPNPTQATRCISCLTRSKSKVCATGANPAASSYSCLDINQAASDCQTCAVTAADYTGCSNCVNTAPYGPGCTECTRLSGAAAQARCYSCRTTNKVQNSVCSDCDLYLTDSASKASCSSCLNDRKIPAAAKSWCMSCQAWYFTPADRQRCVKCLGEGYADLYAVCSQLNGTRARFG